MGSVPSGEDPRLREKIFIGLSLPHTQNVLITLPEWGLNGDRSLLNMGMTVFPPASSLLSQGLDIIAGILVVCCPHRSPAPPPPPPAQLLFLPCVGHVLRAQQLLEHSKSIHILT